MNDPAPWLRRLIGPAHVVGYLAATAAWIVVLGVAVAVYLLATGADTQRVDVAALGSLMSALTIVQLVGMAALAALGGLLLPGGSARWAENLAFARPAWADLGLAASLGVFVGQLPSWLGDRLRDAFPDYSPFVAELIGSALSGSALDKLLMGLAVCVAAPICEELVFRGYLWRALELSFPPWGVVGITAVVFTGYHLDPAQMVGVLPIGVVLGFARWQTGSIWPGVALHAVNNGLALLGSALVDDPAQWPTPWWAAAIGTVFTLALCVALARRPRPGGAVALQR